MSIMSAITSDEALAMDDVSSEALAKGEDGRR